MIPDGGWIPRFLRHTPRFLAAYRIAELESLAREILATYGKPAGVRMHESFVTDEQIESWAAIANGEGR